MSAPDPIIQVLTTFAGLERELAEAQKGPMDPRMRAELARLTASVRGCLGRLEASKQSAVSKLAKKRDRVAAMAAANQKAIAQKQEQLTKTKPPSEPTTPPTQPIDPTLGARLATELLARQPSEKRALPRGVDGVLDQWEWTATGSCACVSAPKSDQ